MVLRNQGVKIIPMVLLMHMMSAAAYGQDTKQPVQASTVNEQIKGIWWSPEMFQAAAFVIRDSTIYYPDAFEEHGYRIVGDSLFVYRPDGAFSSYIVKASSDTLILSAFGFESLYLRTEPEPR